MAEQSKRAFLALPEDPEHFVIRQVSYTRNEHAAGLRQHGAMILPWGKPGNWDETALARDG